MCLNPIRIKLNDRSSHESGATYIFVPCGKCVHCLRKKQNEVSRKLEIECSRNLGNNEFLTLTFEDKYLPRYIDNNGKSVAVLDNSLISAFIHRVRRRMHYYAETKDPSYFDKEHFKYYCAGEYGSKTHRPHYHLILFNVSHYDCLKFFYPSWEFGYKYSRPITPTFKHKDGNIYADSTAKYVSKYMYKGKFEQTISVPVKPRAISSKNIGKDFIIKNSSYYLSGFKDALDLQNAIYMDYQSRFYEDFDITPEEKVKIENPIVIDALKHPDSLLAQTARRMFYTNPQGHKVLLPSYIRNEIYSYSKAQAKVLNEQPFEKNIHYERKTKPVYNRHTHTYDIQEVLLPTSEDSQLYRRSKLQDWLLGYIYFSNLEVLEGKYKEIASEMGCDYHRAMSLYHLQSTRQAEQQSIQSFTQLKNIYSNDKF